MPFLPAISGWAREPAGPRCKLHVSATGRLLDRRRLTFVMSRELVELAGWQGGERFVIALGVGADLGAFQISRVTRSNVGLRLIPQSNARGFRLHLSLPPEIHGIRPAVMLDALTLPASLAFEIRDCALELRCPGPTADIIAMKRG